MLSLTFIIGGSCHKYNFCCEKSFVATNISSFVVTKVCLLRPNVYFVVKIVMTNVCRDKRFVMTKALFCHEKHVCRDRSKLVTTKLLS